MKHASEAQLNDYVDGVLDPAERSALEAHFEACPPCAAELAALRSVVLDVQGLPPGVQPPRDLLRDIHRAIDRERVVALPATRWRALYSMRWQLATAAMLLMLVTAVFTQQAASKKQRMQTATQNADAVLVSTELRSLEEKYLDAIIEMQTLLSAQQSGLSPETRNLLQENLRVIDQAIGESRAAVQRDPGNTMINEMLRSAYEKKLDVLRRAAAVTST